METRQYAVGDVITMRLMQREKGSLVAMPSSQWVKVEEPVRFGGEAQHLCCLLLFIFLVDCNTKMPFSLPVVSIKHTKDAEHSTSK